MEGHCISRGWTAVGKVAEEQQIYKDLPHGMPATEADTINPDLLALLKKSEHVAARCW
jgi:hypothetical protein